MQAKAIHPDVNPCYHGQDTIYGREEYSCSDQALHMIRNINDMNWYIYFLLDMLGTIPFTILGPLIPLIAHMISF
jgi:hypothetical protein